MRQPCQRARDGKCGMRHEGTLRGKVFNKGNFHDVELWAMLREDWDARH